MLESFSSPPSAPNFVLVEKNTPWLAGSSSAVLVKSIIRIGDLFLIGNAPPTTLTGLCPELGLVTLGDYIIDYSAVSSEPNGSVIELSSNVYAYV